LSHPAIHPYTSSKEPILAWTAVTVIALSFLALVIFLQRHLDLRIDAHAAKIEELAQLPRGEYLKPALLGYHHVGADVLWLRLLQVLGKKKNTADEYEWLYHALDVVTTLDPQYAYAYYVGGVVLNNYANRVDLSNRLLEKGHRENPDEWNLPFLLGHNHYFVLGDATMGADYIGKAARTSGAPDFLPGLATRMHAEAGNPDVALEFLEALWRENPDLIVREKLETRAKEVMIERDLRLLEQAIGHYHKKYQAYPKTLTELASAGYLPRIPEEPFGGSYELNSRTGQVTSSTHPTRLKVFRRDLESGM
ncbi:MAG: tetratricopeptide repeat protein, partial [Nitrospira sp.]|nr:tetratricopeptide repeat protein [Nitrospira sp.]